MIGLDAPTINVSGMIVANGGGGGGGGSIDDGGGPAGDGTTTNWNVRASNGLGDQNSKGNGGDGAKGTTINMASGVDGSNSVGGGGGGGGSLGVVWTWGTLTPGAMISPAPVTH
jgi:hypothetical protein